MNRLVLVCALLAAAPATPAEQSHRHLSAYAGQQHREIKTFSDEDLAELRRGGGWGLARAAELNGVPGPAHVLELKSGIALSADRVRATEAVFARMQSEAMEQGKHLIGNEALEGTESVFADQTVEGRTNLDVGGVDFELYEVGPAHTPGDIVVWLPAVRVLFSGDVVYLERMLGVNSHSNNRHWIAAFEQIASLQPEVVVPGHGPVADLERAKADTYDYLVFLREAVGAFMEAGGNIADIGSIDQSRFQYLENYGELAGRNAQQVYQEMEWE